MEVQTFSHVNFLIAIDYIQYYRVLATNTVYRLVNKGYNIMNSMKMAFISYHIQARQDELNAEKEELEIRQVELQSEHDKESEANRKILKKYKKMMKKKKKLELALEIIGSDSD